MLRIRRNYIAAARNISLHLWRLAAARLRNVRREVERLGLAGYLRAKLTRPRPPRPELPQPVWDEPRRARLAMERFSALGGAPERVAAGKPTLALVTPFPPDRTGIAGYAAALAPALAAYYDLTLITSGRDAAASGFPARREAWFAENGHLFDRVLYQIGNAPFHAGMPELLARWPGVVALHDVGLGDLGAWLENMPEHRGVWPGRLYDSHGYRGLLTLMKEGAGAAAQLPASLFVFEQSQGVLVHSRFARDLAAAAYGPEAVAHTEVIPFVQPLRPGDRSAARARLGLTPDELVVCSFGFAGETKLSRELVAAWQVSRLCAKGRLVLVGAAPTNAYGAALAADIASRPGARVEVTGYADGAAFSDWLAAADFAVQLRTRTRGETSGALFDAMAAGLPVIVNAHGALAEAPPAAVLSLPETFSPAELAEAMERLAHDKVLRKQLSAAGIEAVARDHAPEAVAARYHAAIEAMVDQTPPLHSPSALRAAAEAAGDPEMKASALVRASGPRPGLRHLYVDVTAIAREDLGTGIQRVVRAQLLGLLRSPPEGVRVEPVRIADSPAGPRLMFARRYAAQLLGLRPGWLRDEPAELRGGDVYYAPDLAQDVVARAEAGGLYRDLRAAGVAVHFLVHDILPLTHPEMFPPGADEPHARWFAAVARAADQLICISAEVRNAVAARLASTPASAPASTLAGPGPRLSVLPHGADLDAGRAALQPGRTPAALRRALAARPSFLMVGTVEPRKGVDQALAAFERLWSEGVEANLVIVGAEGWRGLPEASRRTLPETVDALRRSRHRGRRLFWLEDAPDAVLSDLMRKADALLAASWAEGFGLPLVEAALAGLPIMARDIPVFREVAGRHATYFTADDPEALAHAVRTWLEVGDEGRVRGFAALTWAENVARLKDLLGFQPTAIPAAAAMRSHRRGR